MIKLMYALQASWFNASARRRLDAFQNRCLRRILGIPASFLSHVRNDEVISRAGVCKATATLAQRQLNLFGRVAVDPAARALRDSILEPGTMNLKNVSERRRGRPRHYWPQMVRNLAEQVAGSRSSLQACLGSSVDQLATWKRLVHRHFKP